MADIYEEIVDEHRQVRKLMDSIVKREGDVDRLFAELQTKYTAHARAEESVFYPPLLRPQETRGPVFEGIVEHHVSDVLMDEMARQDSSTDEWHAEAQVLKDVIRLHLSKEERVLIAHAREVMDEDWAAQAAEGFEQEEQRLRHGAVAGGRAR